MRPGGEMTDKITRIRKRDGTVVAFVPHRFLSAMKL
jgi:hypothetical protein